MSFFFSPCSASDKLRDNSHIDKMSLEGLRKEAKDSMGEVEDLIPKRISDMKIILEKGKILKIKNHFEI